LAVFAAKKYLLKTPTLLILRSKINKVGVFKNSMRLRQRKKVLKERCFHWFCESKSVKTVFFQNII